MSARRRALRLACLAALPALLLAASWSPLLAVPQQFDPAQFRLNELRWRALPDARRAELRAAWDAFNARPDDERERYVQCMDVLRRMKSSLRRILGREPRAAELAFQLEQVRAPMHAWLAGEVGLQQPLDEAALHDVAQREITARIGAWLDGLVLDGSLQPADQARLLEQPTSLLIRDALRLRADGRHRTDGEAGAPPVVRVGAAPGMLAMVRKEEREALESSRTNALRGPRDEHDVDPLRLRLLKLSFLKARLIETGLSEQEANAVLSLPLPDLESELEARLGQR